MNWIPFQPHIAGQESDAFFQTVRALARRAQDAVPKHRKQLLEELRSPLSSRKLRVRLAQSLLLDLVEQGWQVRVSAGEAAIHAPRTEGETPEETKERIRQAHLVDRDLQLQQPAVQAFVRSMEQRRLTKNGWHSIFSLMREGRELAGALERTVDSGTDDPLAEAISPYLQFVEQGAVCEHTGLRLSDIWRYFRLTWVNAYRSLPGRTMLILVRDAAATNHPVIGIAALGSSVVQQESRDRWIGWTGHEFIKSLEARPAPTVKKWILKWLETLIGEVYVKDLVKDGLMRRKDLENPSAAVIERLHKEGAEARTQHWRNPRAVVHRAHQKGIEGDWEEAARTSLFRSKRCEVLARLLTIRSVLSEHVQAGRGVGAMLSSPPARTALAQLVRLVKAQRVGIDMMDITVCGAVAPYNALLGGKLVCMLLASHEVVEYHRLKYETQASVIASSMKGEAVRRPPRLVLLGTTSLYGVGSSQYNRVKVPGPEVRGRAGEALEYKRLGLSKGYGSFHFSGTTIELIDVLLARRDEGRRVNSLFGEGVNPLLRKIREALEYLQLRSDSILNHGNPRVVYGVALARNFNDVLLGFAAEADYLVPPSENPRRSTQLLASYWRRRWLALRAARPEILESVKAHTLAYPITHGARVPLLAPGGQRELDLSIGGD